ncbi:MAG: 2,3-bisphosphoglycerate-independent phosphoglycerate mutase, partial [Gammaproteobacteria bacterium]|nr:2,3-bisphosphoglycerate-independent phosphoglycerate mutase [Gammaproteobacteria bacterium]
HIIAACQLASQRGARRVYVHAFLDGRDTPPRSAAPSLEVTQAALRDLGTGRIASVVGRYFAMDRDKRWDRVEKAYHLLTLGEAPFRASTPQEALDAAYARGEDDEFVQATRVQADGEDDARIRDGDTVLFMNFRADRARELTHAFLDEPFNGFERRVRPQLAEFVMLTEYEAGIPAPIAYTTENLSNSIGEYLAGLGKTQLRIAETEKYAHVTFFFSGGREATFAGEERILVPSPQVATYDLKPEMSAPEVTDKLVEAIRSRRHDLVVVNYANGDMVGHTGKFSAAIQAAECLDTCLKRVTEALAEVGGQGLITADHGNLEQMDDPDSGQAHTQHTVGPVPLVYVGPRPVRLQSGGRLCDIAPSLLALMDLPQPAEMTGHSLIGAAD